MKDRILIQVGNVLMPIQDLTQEEALSHNVFTFYRGKRKIGSAKFSDVSDTSPRCECSTFGNYTIFSTTVFLIVDKRVSQCKV